MQEIHYKDMKFNPFNLISDEWMLVTAGDEASCNTMTASWGHLGCLWGHNDPTAVIYLRPSRYTKEFVDEEGYFSLCVMDKSFKKQMAYLGNVSGRDEDKIGKAGRTNGRVVTEVDEVKPTRQTEDVVWRNVVMSKKNQRIICIDRYLAVVRRPEMDSQGHLTRVSARD